MSETTDKTGRELDPAKRAALLERRRRERAILAQMKANLAAAAREHEQAAVPAGRGKG